MLYVLCRQWTHERETLTALGVKDPDRLDDILGLNTTSAVSADPQDRRAQALAMGGEVG